MTGGSPCVRLESSVLDGGLQQPLVLWFLHTRGGSAPTVMPAKAGIQASRTGFALGLDPRFRGGDANRRKASIVLDGPLARLCAFLRKSELSQMVMLRRLVGITH